MYERDVVKMYVHGQLPAEVRVMEVPIADDGYGELRIQLPVSREMTFDKQEGGWDPSAPDWQTATVQLHRYDDIQEGLVAGYAPGSKRLVVGRRGWRLAPTIWEEEE